MNNETENNTMGNNLSDKISNYLEQKLGSPILISHKNENFYLPFLKSKNKKFDAIFLKYKEILTLLKEKKKEDGELKIKKKGLPLTSKKNKIRALKKKASKKNLLLKGFNKKRKTEKDDKKKTKGRSKSRTKKKSLNKSKSVNKLNKSKSRSVIKDTSIARKKLNKSKSVKKLKNEVKRFAKKSLKTSKLPHYLQTTKSRRNSEKTEKPLKKKKKKSIKTVDEFYGKKKKNIGKKSFSKGTKSMAILKEYEDVGVRKKDFETFKNTEIKEIVEEENIDTKDEEKNDEKENKKLENNVDEDNLEKDKSILLENEEKKEIEENNKELKRDLLKIVLTYLPIKTEYILKNKFFLEEKIIRSLKKKKETINYLKTKLQKITTQIKEKDSSISPSEMKLPTNFKFTSETQNLISLLNFENLKIFLEEDFKDKKIPNFLLLLYTLINKTIPFEIETDIKTIKWNIIGIFENKNDLENNINKIDIKKKIIIEKFLKKPDTMYYLQFNNVKTLNKVVPCLFHVLTDLLLFNGFYQSIKYLLARDCEVLELGYCFEFFQGKKMIVEEEVEKISKVRRKIFGGDIGDEEKKEEKKEEIKEETKEENKQETKEENKEQLKKKEEKKVEEENKELVKTVKEVAVEEKIEVKEEVKDREVVEEAKDEVKEEFKTKTDDMEKDEKTDKVEKKEENKEVEVTKEILENTENKTTEENKNQEEKTEKTDS